MFTFIKTPTMYSLIFLLCSAVKLQAVEYVISDEGKHIQLNDDGTWAQVSKDRYATTRDGRRIKLRPDGSWEEVREALHQPEEALSYNDQVLSAQKVEDVNDVVILLDKVEILKIKTKLKKSARLDTRTVFHLRIKNEVDSSTLQSENLMKGLSAYSSSGQKFPIERIVPTKQADSAGHTVLTIVTDGSPKWFGVKYLSLAINQNLLGNRSKRILSRGMDEVVIRTVKSFKE